MRLNRSFHCQNAVSCAISVSSKILTLIHLLLIGSIVSVAGAEEAMPSFEAVYDVRYGPLRGTMLLRLSRLGDRHIYETSLEPRGIATLLRRGIIYEMTTLEISGSEVRPLDYIQTDTISDPTRVAHYFFDAATVGGIYKGRQFAEPMRVGGQNRISAQIALMHSLRHSRPLSEFAVFDRARWKEYEFDILPSKQVKTVSGNYEAVEARYAERDDDKSTSIFFAPALEWLPVTIVYREGGRDKSRATLKRYSLFNP
jgi:hypothetical protein